MQNSTRRPTKLLVPVFWGSGRQATGVGLRAPRSGSLVGVRQ